MTDDPEGRLCIWVDPDSEYEGTEYPIGMRETPVNNLKDAIAICEKMAGSPDNCFIKIIPEHK